MPDHPGKPVSSIGHSNAPTPDLAGRVIAVCVGAAGLLRTEHREIASAFVKQSIDGQVALGPLGLTGDEHVYHGHGGPDMALLAYPSEHYDHWRNAGIDLPPVGAMAENLTTEGLLETDVHIGDVFTLGTATVQVCETRSPCFKIAARYGRPDLAVAVQSTGFTGYLLRVLTPGEISAGDTMALVRRDDHGVSVAEAGRIMNVDRHDLDGARRLLAIPALGASARRTMAARLHGHVADLQGLHTERLFGEPEP